MAARAVHHTLLASCASALVAAVVAVGPPVAADSPNGNDTTSAGSGVQAAEWHASSRSVSLTAHPFDSLNPDRCMDAMLDWKHTSGSHYDSRVVRSCRAGFVNHSYTWDGGNATGVADLNLTQFTWIEPLTVWNSAGISESQKGYCYELDEDYVNCSFAIYDEEQFAGAGSPNCTTVPRTCTDRWARVLTLYQDGHYTGCKNYPANSATS